MWRCCLIYVFRGLIIFRNSLESANWEISTAVMTFFPSFSVFKVLGYLNRNALDTKNLIKEIKAIASIPTERYFFNVSDEVALLEKAGTLGEQIFSIEGKRTPSFMSFLSKTFFKNS